MHQLFRLPENYMAYHQPNESGHISPRKLVKAQQKIAFEHNGCKFINGHGKSIEKEDDDLFNVTVAKYFDNDKENAETIIVQGRRLIIATGAYANVKPDIQVMKKISSYDYKRSYRSKIVFQIIQQMI